MSDEQNNLLLALGRVEQWARETKGHVINEEWDDARDAAVELERKAETLAQELEQRSDGDDDE